MLRRHALWLSALIVPLACSDSTSPQSDLGFQDVSASADASVATDGGINYQGDYQHNPPQLSSVPDILKGDTWKTHYIEDILPYWMMPEAFGMPEGNFPTNRGMDGKLAGSSERRPRMIARQTYAYSVGYLLTGDARLLELAKAGANWIISKAKDTTNGGFHTRLQENGDPAGNDAKTAQDTAYCMLGLGAYYFVTRDPQIETVILETRDLLFSDTFWDNQNKRILDGVSVDLSSEHDVEGDGGWELVAQLDPINAFLLLTQPVLSEESRRKQFLGDLEQLAQSMIDNFYSEGFIWGVHNRQGRYRTKHVDFGHALKAYWMILEIDKRLDGHPFYSFLQNNIHNQVERAYDRTNKLWGKRPTSATNIERGTDWWIYAELDQVTATLDMVDQKYLDKLENTQKGWIDNYVDGFWDPGEVIPGINAQGGRVYNWPQSDTAKCNIWKNGYHSSEHALVLYLMGKYLENTPATLYFAVPAASADSFVARPYFFHGETVSRTPAEEITVDGAKLQKVEVQFQKLY